MSTSGSAAIIARKGVGKLFSATKSGLSALTGGISKARKGYANKHEIDVLDGMRQKGLAPADFVFLALRRIYFLYLAGYKTELAAAATETGKRLVELERSTLPLDVVIILGNSVCEESLKYGSFEKTNFAKGVLDLINSSKVGKDHCDRSSVAHDFYYALLNATEVYGAEWQDLDRTFREAASRVIGNAIHPTYETKDAREKAAKALYLFALEIKTIAQESEGKRQKALKDAENLLKKEQDRQRKASSSSV